MSSLENTRKQILDRFGLDLIMYSSNLFMNAILIFNLLSCTQPIQVLDSFDKADLVY